MPKYGTARARGFQIFLPLIQFALVVSIAVYLAAIRVAFDRRNRRTWEQMIMRLDPGPGRLATFRNAGILLEMIDHACQADGKIDASLAEALRREAMRVRLAAVLGSAPLA